MTQLGWVLSAPDPMGQLSCFWWVGGKVCLGFPVASYGKTWMNFFGQLNTSMDEFLLVCRLRGGRRASLGPSLLSLLAGVTGQNKKKIPKRDLRKKCLKAKLMHRQTSPLSSSYPSSDANIFTVKMCPSTPTLISVWFYVAMKMVAAETLSQTGGYILCNQN